jgi:uncharacterized membrane protein (DUF373 family)
MKEIINLVIKDICADIINVRTVITLTILFTCRELVLQGKLNPEVFSASWQIMLGFWFGSKVASAKKE